MLIVDVQAKLFLVLYPSLVNSTTRITIAEMPILKQQLPHINVTDTEIFYIASPFKRVTESIFDDSVDEDWIWEIRAKTQNLFTVSVEHQWNLSDFLFIEEFQVGRPRFENDFYYHF